MSNHLPNSTAPLVERAWAPVFLARIALLAALWLAASGYVVSWSERFYLAVPWVFAAEAIWMARRGDKKRAVRRAATVAAGLFVLLAVFAFDVYRPSRLLQPFERCVVAYGLMSLLVVASWLWKLIAFPLRRLLATAPRAPRWRSLAVRVAAILIFASALNAYALSFLETHWPKRLDWVTPAQLRLTFETVSWESRDGTPITGWFVPAEGATRTAVVCHGVGAYKADMLEFVHALQGAGFNVLAFDFRGHGESGGHTVSYGNQEKWDIITGIDMLGATYPAQSQRIVGVGWSMGAAALILAAAQDERLEALHIDAAYARTFDMAKVIAAPFPAPFRWTGLHLGTALGCLESGSNLFTLAPVEAIARLAPRPVMIIHGSEDRLIPIEQGRLLYEAARHPKHWHVVAGAGHCQALSLESPRYERRMIRFLDGALDAPPAQGRVGAPPNR